jgi:hypothetical protein
VRLVGGHCHLHRRAEQHQPNARRKPQQKPFVHVFPLLASSFYHLSQQSKPRQS